MLELHEKSAGARSVLAECTRVVISISKRAVWDM